MSVKCRSTTLGGRTSEKNSPLGRYLGFLNERRAWRGQSKHVGMNMRYFPSLCIGLTGFIFLTVCRAAPVEFSQQALTFTHILCPANCGKGIKSFLQPLIGQKVHIGPNQFSGVLVDKLFDPCDGTVEIRLKSQSRQQQIAELKKMIAPHCKFDAASLRLPAQVVSALAVCNSLPDGKSGSGVNNMAHIISIEDGRVLVLFEELTILELRGNIVPAGK